MKLSVYIVTLNEEKRLEKTLFAVSQVADEIIVVDSGSTDKTEEIAKKYNCKFIFHKWKNISSQKLFAQNQCQNDFVLSLDADEVLSDELIKEINNIKYHFDADGYKIVIKDIFPNQNKPSVFAKKYNLIRLYNKNVITMPNDLTHDRVVFIKEKPTIKQLKNIVYHYSYISLTKMWNKLNLYTDELLTTSIKQNKMYSKYRLIYEFPFQFIKYYLIKRYFLNGWFGVINSVSLAYFRFLKIAKNVEYQMVNKQNRDDK